MRGDKVKYFNFSVLLFVVFEFEESVNFSPKVYRRLMKMFREEQLLGKGDFSNIHQRKDLPFKFH